MARGDLQRVHLSPGLDSEAARRRSLPRPSLDPRRPAAWFVEPERSATGDVVPVLTVLLVNRECPWRCVYCDLWRQTLDRNVLPGDVPAQVDVALAGARSTAAAPRHLKLYNAGSFFDRRAIPPEDLPHLAGQGAAFERVVVECHPALIGDRVWRFQEALARAAAAAGADRPPALEVAMGLETADPAVLARLNRQMTLAGFQRATARLREHGVAVRAFVLVQPPYQDAGDAVQGAVNSAAFAYGCGVEVVTFIPVRSGNPELEALRAAGHFSPPSLATLEQAVDEALPRAHGRLFADLWEVERFATCPACAGPRKERLARLNLSQLPEPPVQCAVCAGPRP